eukprot:TRINITY_DN5989_c0_g1_i1.p1 TRINITY_DN5989_c0_g1~~TRINITY_DN5989_c0_g1_i1.p1  ORF type:complete len:284 (+),score=41.13 TRINITY_DN5989_c0_g1_i1:564-1415(+)
MLHTGVTGTEAISAIDGGDAVQRMHAAGALAVQDGAVYLDPLFLVSRVFADSCARLAADALGPGAAQATAMLLRGFRLGDPAPLCSEADLGTLVEVATMLAEPNALPLWQGGATAIAEWRVGASGERSWCACVDGLRAAVRGRAAEEAFTAALGAPCVRVVAEILRRGLCSEVDAAAATLLSCADSESVFATIRRTGLGWTPSLLPTRRNLWTASWSSVHQVAVAVVYRALAPQVTEMGAAATTLRENSIASDAALADLFRELETAQSAVRASCSLALRLDFV